eukprot:81020-Pyramimonas_sp.AAC.1
MLSAIGAGFGSECTAARSCANFALSWQLGNRCVRIGSGCVWRWLSQSVSACLRVGATWWREYGLKYWPRALFLCCRSCRGLRRCRCYAQRARVVTALGWHVFVVFEDYECPR